MRNIRLIARLDVKTEHLVKGVHLDGVRKLGKPNEFARKYYEQGIDEVIYMDAVASLYGRNSLLPIIRQASDDIFIPMTVGGGIRSLEDARAALQAGADKVAVNSAAITNPNLISHIATEFGSQCMVVSIEAKNTAPGVWDIRYDNGKQKPDTPVSAVEWAKEAESRGAGEILLTSIDREGTGTGMDIALIAAVCDAVSIPVIASGGVGSVAHIEEVIRHANVSAIAVAKLLHYGEATIAQIKAGLGQMSGVEIR